MPALFYLRVKWKRIYSQTSSKDRWKNEIQIIHVYSFSDDVSRMLFKFHLNQNFTNQHSITHYCLITYANISFYNHTNSFSYIYSFFDIHRVNYSSSWI